MATTVTEIAPEVFRFSTLHPDYGIQFSQFLVRDMPFTPYTESTLRRLAELRPAALAVMHGSAFRGDGRAALLGLSAVIKELLG